jgi:EAL domain-containing protein (putative c-di-GMP-specific phosphodiesterase class I)
MTMDESKIDFPSPSTVDESGQYARIATLFQPIISIRRKSIIGFEAFSRGVRAQDGERVEAQTLFGSTDIEDLARIDQACMSNALRRFGPLVKKRPGLKLYLNVDARALPLLAGDYTPFDELIERSGLEPESIVFELPAKLAALDESLNFIDHSRRFGYQLCIDRVGQTTDILGLLIRTNPDYLKLTRDFWLCRQGMTYCADMVASTGKLCRERGCMLIAVGMETEEEALDLLEQGVFNQQGYFYTKAGGGEAATAKKDPVAIFSKAVDVIYTRFKMRRKDGIERRKQRFKQYATAVKVLGARLAGANPGTFDKVLRTVVEADDSAIAAFIIDSRGMQTTPRVVKRAYASTDAEAGQGTGRGEDHTIHDYFLHLETGYDKYVTTPFISPATKRPACMYCSRFYVDMRTSYILCLELDYV